MQTNQPKWDIQKIHDNIPHQHAMDILKTSIGWCKDNDVLFWPQSRDGAYSVRTGYEVIVKSSQVNVNSGPASSSSVDPGLWTLIWKEKIPEKIKLFLYGRLAKMPFL